jgi:hypothetical protein
VHAELKIKGTYILSMNRKTEFEAKNLIKEI